MEYKTCWITVNRACNLRCKWCYAKDSNYLYKDNLDFKTAKEMVDICKDLNIKHITLIGGEPTLYPQLFSLINYIHEKNIHCGFVSNGLAFEDDSYVKKLIDCGIKSFSISLKGENREVFKDVTGYDKWSNVLNGIKTCLDNGCKVTVSMVLTEENIDTFIEGVKQCYDLGVRNFSFSFCYEFTPHYDNINIKNVKNPKNLITKFANIYPKLDEVTNGKFNLFQTFPLCLWDEKFISLMIGKRQITSICQLLNQSGLIFDTDGYIIPCNAMFEIKLGKLKEDFNNAKELMEYVQSKEVVDAYKKLRGLPSVKCLECKKLIYCGGGCVCQWTNYKFEDLFKEV